MRLLSPVLILACVVGSPLAAETNEERGKRIVFEALEALGGAAFVDMRDRVESGRAYSFYRERLSGLSRATIYTRYLTPPDPHDPNQVFVRERQSFGKNEDSSVLFLETGEAWEITYRGAKSLPQATIDRFRESTLRNIFYILKNRLNEPGLIIESKGTEVFQNQPVEIVDITDSENRRNTIYFHRTTKLPVRQVFDRRDPQTRIRSEEVMLFSKYRDVGGGVLWPFVMRRERDGQRVFEIFSDSVEINQDLTDDLFTLTDKIKILDKKPGQ
ncbi:MAG: hypothetical protein ACK5AZ_25225 [Bryobacteraceae bacterium]